MTSVVLELERVRMLRLERINDHKRRDDRRMLRGKLKIDGHPWERRAVEMAEAGYGITAIMGATEIDLGTATMLVLGGKP